MTTNNQSYRAERPKPKTAEESALSSGSMLGSMLKMFWDIVSTLFISMLFSIGVALVGVTFFWPEEGAEHERRTLVIELDALAYELRFVGEALNDVVARFILDSRDNWWGGGVIADFVEWCASFVSPQAAMYGEVVSLTMQIFIVRVGVIISSMPIIILWIGLGVVCGLTERDLRRFNAALESSTTFNLAYRHVKIPFILFIALYLSWPTQAYALLATIPVSIGSFIMFFLAVANYKKRL